MLVCLAPMSPLGNSLLLKPHGLGGHTGRTQTGLVMAPFSPPAAGERARPTSRDERWMDREDPGIFRTSFSP